MEKNWFMLLAVHLLSYGCTWEVTHEARVALGYALSNSYASLVLSQLSACIHNSIGAR